MSGEDAMRQVFLGPSSGVASLSSECLSDEDVLAFASGRLQSARYDSAHLHFDQCEVCQRLLSEAAHALAMAATTPLAESDGANWNTTFQPGMLVGRRYLIRRFIVRGGMGEVYEALDRELQERVALKTVTSTACDNLRAVRLLKGEVQLARLVSHPNVCRIYDFGTHVMPQTGAPISFLTMQFVDGETLGQRVRLEGALPVPEACELARKLLLGLSAAHAAGVLHRDFKSDNVMLKAEPGTEQSDPVILDFGLARALDHDSQSSSVSSASLVGTFGYIAPEQLEGKPHSTASDVYSFGVVFFEMLTGELPFESSSSPAVAALERLKRSAVAPSTINPLVSSDLDALVLGCLRRFPKDRLRTPGEVLRELDAIELKSFTKFEKARLLPLALASFGVCGLAAYFALAPSTPQHAPARAASAFTEPKLSVVPSKASSLPEALPSSHAPPMVQLAPVRTIIGTAASETKTKPGLVARASASADVSKAASPRSEPPALAGSRAALATASFPTTSSSPAQAPPNRPGGWEDPFRPQLAAAKEPAKP